MHNGVYLVVNRDPEIKFILEPDAFELKTEVQRAEFITQGD